MRYSLAPLALAALAAASPVPQGVTENLSPEGSAPEGCESSYDGSFNIQIVNVSDISTKRSIHKRQAITLAMTLENGVLTDSEDRTGYIAANSQFQFDAPPQTGAIYTSGFSACSNGSLALGPDAVFYSCLSGDFYNLYDENVLDTDQCVPVVIQILPSGGSSGGQASVMPDGQPTGSAVEQISDGQVTGSAVAPATQIPDGQIQATPAVAPVSQIPDGQIQATPAAPAAPVSQIPDGQIQATPVAPVSQIPDGQIQATPAPAPAPSGSPVSQISDGQIQAPTANGTMAYPSPSVSVEAQTDNAAAPVQLSSGLGLMAAIFGLAMI